MKGICFIEELFAKIADGSKTQTRRILKGSDRAFPHPIENTINLFNNMKSKCVTLKDSDIDMALQPRLKSYEPRYRAGELVYLKEPYCLYEEKNPELKTTEGLEIAYKYGNKMDIEEITGISNAKWSNKLFMPEMDARYYILIIAVRCEKLQDISDEDCLREGIIKKYLPYAPFLQYIFQYKLNETIVESISYDTPQEAYGALINKINGKETWDNNPWVFVYDFCLCDKPYCDYGK